MQRPNVSRFLVAGAIAGALFPVVQAAFADEIIEETRRTTTVEGMPLESTTTTTTKTTTERSVVVTPTPAIPVIPGPVVVTSETVVPIALSDAQVVLQTIDLRRAEIDRKIIEARSSGSISEAKASTLRRELDRIGAAITDLKTQSSPSLALSLSLAQDLDALASHVSIVYSSYAYVPIIEGSHFTIFNGRIIQLDELAIRRIGLENKILDRLYAGRISYGQSVELRSDLSKIAALEDAYRSTRARGDLSNREAREIYTDFDKVADKIDDYAGRR